jgi:hypothetical protein
VASQHTVADIETTHYQTTTAFINNNLDSFEDPAEVNMSETELMMSELGGSDLDLPSSLVGLSSLDELVDILGIKEGAALEQFPFCDLDETLLRHTFDTEDQWPI